MAQKNKKRPKVFISYAWDDQVISKQLSEYLKRDGIEIWMDVSSIIGGDSLPRRISDALDWCDTLVLLWSKSAAKSRWVELEWTNAFALQKNVIPCVLDDERLPSLLASRVYVDLSNFKSGYSNLFRALGLLVDAAKPETIPEIVIPDPKVSDETIKSRNKIFISYSHKNSVWLDRLRVHLRPLENNYAIDVWDDRKIKAGQLWRKEIRNAIKSARVAILLISADFLASDFIVKDELPPLLNAAKEEGLIILPIIVSPCRFMRTENLAQYQAVNDPRKPLVAMNEYEQEKLFDEVSETIETALNI